MLQASISSNRPRSQIYQINTFYMVQTDHVTHTILFHDHVWINGNTQC